MSKASSNIVIGLYYHPELYPPTLSAINELAKIYDNVIVIHRAHLENHWAYPSNVIVIPQGKVMSPKTQEQLPLYKKIILFFNFSICLFKGIYKYKPNTVLLYDAIALFAFHNIRRLFRKKITWYHNHDVAEIDRVRKYSIAWFSIMAEKKAFKYLDLFTLPAEERLKYFPADTMKGRYFVLPNYPLVSFYRKFYQPKSLGNTIKLIFQGNISGSHGLDEIVELLPTKILNYQLNLVLKGPRDEAYMDKLKQKIESLQVSDKVEIIGVTPYSEVPVAASSCNIGIGIYAKKDLMNVTIGTASNKLYEYAAVGLPVLYYCNENQKKYLKGHSWAFATTASAVDISRQIELIIKSYDKLSLAAHKDFVNELNYEKHFEPVRQHILTKLARLK